MLQLTNNIFTTTAHTFVDQALSTAIYQYTYNEVYSDYVNAIKASVFNITSLTQIPFLPIQFFKTKEVITNSIFIPKTPITFTSSGTTGVTTASHIITDINIYHQSFTKAFTLYYGNPQQYCILGLLPNYILSGGSSLVYMVDALIKQSNHNLSGFYLHNYEQLQQTLIQLQANNQPTILFGVTYALLQFAQLHKLHLPQIKIIETGGMKGMGEELTRPQVHQYLQEQLGVQVVHSEYGMTELLSQAYTSGGEIFTPPNWLKVLVRKPDDPLAVSLTGRGVLNIIDLANVNSCCFIATDDVGEVFADGSFTVLGRLDNSDIRGCNLLVA